VGSAVDTMVVERRYEEQRSEDQAPLTGGRFRQ
jgi:hypothetical protein